jgi:hypothetical protein
LALDRVRELLRCGELQSMRPQVDSAQELLDLLKQGEDGSMDYAAAAGLVHTRVSDVRPQSIVSEALAQAVSENQAPPRALQPRAATAQPVAIQVAASRPASSQLASTNTAVAGGDGYVPAVPDERIASGLVWPPVDGRTVLQELARARIPLRRSEQGAWTGTVKGRWQIRSENTQVFNDIDAGRAILVRAARVYATNTRGKSVDRCVVLAADGHGRYRLWHIIRLPTVG